MRVAVLAIGACLATLGVTLVADEAEARCAYGNSSDCIVQGDGANLCLTYWYCIPDCYTEPGGYCHCAPECAPPPDPS
jgi:hypothetical protein